MKKILRELDWRFDYHIRYILLQGNDRYLYFEYMVEKWGKKFIDRVDRDYRNRYPFE